MDTYTRIIIIEIMGDVYDITPDKTSQTAV